MRNNSNPGQFFSSETGRYAWLFVIRQVEMKKVEKERRERERERRREGKREEDVHAYEGDEEKMKEGERERDEDMVRGYIPQGCDSRTMYGYWAAGGIDSHDEGATDHPETETPVPYLHLLRASYSFYCRRLLRFLLDVKPFSLSFLPHSTAK